MNDNCQHSGCVPVLIALAAGLAFLTIVLATLNQ